MANELVVNVENGSDLLKEIKENLNPDLMSELDTLMLDLSNMK